MTDHKDKCPHQVQSDFPNGRNTMMLLNGNAMALRSAFLPKCSVYHGYYFV